MVTRLMSSSYFKIKQFACQLLRLATCTFRLGTYVRKDVARESRRDFERVDISYNDIALKVTAGPSRDGKETQIKRRTERSGCAGSAPSRVCPF